MTIQLIPLDQIDSNPWQTRPIDFEYIEQELEPDIAARGMIQTPIARPRPDRPGRFQLAFGHHRKMVFSRLHSAHVGHAPNSEYGWDVMPLDIQTLDDQQMFEYAIVENEKRRPTTAIEKAKSLQAYIEQFHVSQTEAGKLFGLSQSAVANLVRLLKLPELVQAQVASGAVPERLARQLVTLAPLGEFALVGIAEAVAKADEAGREPAYSQALDTALREHAKPAGPYDLAWPVAWPEKPIPLAEADAKAVAQSATPFDKLPACDGCAFHVKRQYNQYCVRPQCFEFKQVYFSASEVERLSKELGIAPLGPDERFAMIWTGDWQHETGATKNLKAKDKTHLRLMPWANSKQGTRDGNQHVRERVLGSKVVALASMDKAKYIKVGGLAEQQADADAGTAVPSEGKSPAERQKEDREKQKREQEQRATWAHETVRLVNAAAAHLAPSVMPSNEWLMDWLYSALEDYGWESVELPGRSEWKGLPLAKRQAEVLAGMLLTSQHIDTEPSNEKDVRNNITEIEKIAASLKVKLPKGWDAKPVEVAAPAEKAKAQKVAKPASASTKGKKVKK